MMEMELYVMVVIHCIWNEKLLKNLLDQKKHFLDRKLSNVFKKLPWIRIRNCLKILKKKFFFASKVAFNILK